MNVFTFRQDATRYMARYTKGTETKRQLVDCVYRMLQQQDASTITVRTIAASLDLSPAAIYRHFESLDYLIVVASVRMLHSYMEEYAELVDIDSNPIETYIKGWELFSRYAFERPDIYYRLFWGDYNQSMDDAMQDYYSLFPFEASEKSAAFFYVVMFNADMNKRDELALHATVTQGLMTEEDAAFYSKSNILIARGLIFEAMSADRQRRKELQEECTYLIRKNMGRAFGQAA